VPSSALQAAAQARVQPAVRNRLSLRKRHHEVLQGQNIPTQRCAGPKKVHSFATVFVFQGFQRPRCYIPTAGRWQISSDHGYPEYHAHDSYCAPSSLRTARSRCQLAAVTVLACPASLLLLAAFLTGKGKLSNIGKVSEFFASLGIPVPTLNAYLIGSLECLGSLLLIIGLASRPLSLLIVISMTVAYLTADFEAVSWLFQ